MPIGRAEDFGAGEKAVLARKWLFGSRNEASYFVPILIKVFPPRKNYFHQERIDLFKGVTIDGHNEASLLTFSFSLGESGFVEVSDRWWS